MKRILLLCGVFLLMSSSYAVSNQVIITKSDGTLLIMNCDDIADISFSGTISIEDQPKVAAIFELKQNYPNPFNPTTAIEFDLLKSGKTELEIYNSNGQLVKSLINSELNAGIHKVIWNGTDNHNTQVASGTYFYKVTTNNQTQFKRMLMLK